MRRLICRALIFSLMSMQLAAQPATDARHAQKIRTRAIYALDHHRFVAVETADHRRFQGLVSETRSDRFVLVLQGQTTTLTYAEAERITWRHHMPRAVVAVVVGAAVAGALYALVYLLLEKNG
jgi:ABC-type Fe3+-siderophore transport system permease subunit